MLDILQHHTDLILTLRLTLEGPVIYAEKWPFNGALAQIQVLVCSPESRETTKWALKGRARNLGDLLTHIQFLTQRKASIESLGIFNHFFRWPYQYGLAWLALEGNEGRLTSFQVAVRDLGRVRVLAGGGRDRGFPPPALFRHGGLGGGVW